MSEEKKELSVFAENMAVIATPEGIQKYILGTKKNGSPRAVYDVIKDYVEPKNKSSKKKKKKKNKNKDDSSMYGFYLSSKKKGKKKKKNKDKYWHI